MEAKYAAHPDEIKKWNGIEGYFKQRAVEILHALTNDHAAKMRMGERGLPLIENALQAAFDLGVESVKPPKIDTDWKEEAVPGGGYKAVPQEGVNKHKEGKACMWGRCNGIIHNGVCSYCGHKPL